LRHNLCPIAELRCRDEIPGNHFTIHFQSGDASIFRSRIIHFDVQRQAAKFAGGGEIRPVFRDARIYAQAADFWSDAKKIIRGAQPEIHGCPFSETVSVA
jgi:hypothetical protein